MMKFFIILNIWALLVNFSKAQTNTSTYISVVYSSDLTLNCNLSGNISFYFTENNYTTKQIITYDSVKYSSLNTSVMIIKKLVKVDIQRLYACASNNEIQYFIPKIQPYLYQVDDLLVSVTEGQSASLACYIFIGLAVNWTWSFNNTTSKSILNVTNSSNTRSIFTITQTDTSNSGVYFCTAINEYGSFSRNITLRVKSRLAPLWPFIGILIQVVIMAVVISIYYFQDKKKVS